MDNVGRQLLMSYGLGVRFSSEGGETDLLGQNDRGFDVDEVEARSLVWYGDQDRLVTPLRSRFLIDCLDDPEVAVTPGAGHFRAMREDLTGAVMD